MNAGQGFCKFQRKVSPCIKLCQPIEFQPQGMKVEGITIKFDARDVRKLIYTNV